MRGDKPRVRGGRRRDGARVGVRRVAGPRAAAGLPASREKAQGESAGRLEVPPRRSYVAVVGGLACQKRLVWRGFEELVLPGQI